MDYSSCVLIMCARGGREIRETGAETTYLSSIAVQVEKRDAVTGTLSLILHRQ